jgi:hypothetical protein
MFFKARKVSQLPSSERGDRGLHRSGPVYHIEGQIEALREEYEQRGQPLSPGSKAWLFSYDGDSPQASANLFSLVMTRPSIKSSPTRI